MPNTLTIVCTSTPSTEPVEFQNPNSPGVYVTGTQQANGTWQAVFTGVTKGAYTALLTRLKNYPAVTATIAASGPVLNIQQTAPAGTSATGSGATSISVTANSSFNATAYRFLTASTQAGPYAVLVTQAGASYNHTGLTAGAVVYYEAQYVGGGYYDDSPVSLPFSGTAGVVADYALLVVGDSTAAAGSPSYSLSPVLISEFNQGILNSGGTGSFTSTANTAVSGQSLNLNPDGTAGGMMGPLFASQVAGRYVAGKYNVLIIEGLLNTMSNDVFTNGEAGAATRVLALLKQYIAQVRADNPNWRIITGSLTKRTNGGSAAAIVSDENQRPILNQALVDGFAAGTLDVQAVARFGQDTRLSNPGPNTDGMANNWFTDWVHYTQQTLDQVVGPSFTGAFLFARFGAPQPLPYTGAAVSGLYLPNAQVLPVLVKTSNVIETAVGSGTYVVSPSGAYGSWSGYVVFNAQMPATGTSYMGFKKPALDSVNAIMGLTSSATLPASSNAMYSNLLPSFYQHQDGRVLINETGGGGAYTTTTGGATSYILQNNEYLFLVKNGSALALAKTTDGVTYTTIYPFTGSYPNALYVAATLEASVGKLYGPQGFGLTLAPAAAIGGTITSTRANTAAFVTTGTWTKLAENGGDAFTQTFGDYGIFAFTGTRLRVFGSTGNTAVVRFTLDAAAPVTFNSYAATAVPNTFFYDFPGLVSGSHSLRVEKNANDATYIVLNSFEVTS